MNLNQIHLQGEHALHLPSIISNISRASNAWRSVSTDGIAHVVTFSNALLTFRSHALLGAPCAVSASLQSIHSDANASWQWLQNAHARLTRISQGVNDSAMQLSSENLDKPIVWTLPRAEWARRVREVADAMKDDLAEKKRVLDTLRTASRANLHGREQLELLAASWLEQTALPERLAETLAAMLEAEMEAVREEKAAKGSTPEKEIKDKVSEENMAERKVRERNLSPAMALLLGASPKAKT